MNDVDGIRLGFSMYQGGKDDAIKQVLEIIDEYDLYKSDEDGDYVGDDLDCGAEG